MKTAKYYRLHNNYGEQKGGAGSTKVKRTSEPGWVKKKFYGIKSFIATPFKRPFQSATGLETSKQSNGTNKSKTPQDIFTAKKGTKSAQLRQAQAAAMGITRADQKTVEHITNKLKKPLSNYKKAKYDAKLADIATQLKLSTGAITSHQILPTIKAELNKRKKDYETTTFGALTKTKTKQQALNASSLAFELAKQESATETEKYLKKKTAVELLKKAQNYKTFNQIPLDIINELKAVGITQNSLKNSANPDNPDKTLSELLTTTITNKKTYKQTLKKAFKKEKTQTEQFKKNNKNFEAHTKKYGTTNALSRYSNNQTIGSKLLKVGKYAGVGVVGAAGIGALGLITAIAPPAGVAVAAAGVSAVTGASLTEKFTKKSTLLSTLDSNKSTAPMKETARNLIIQKTKSPQAQYELAKAIKTGQPLINANNILKQKLTGSYQDFKNALNNIPNLSQEDYNKLKDYYKANRIEQIRYGTRYYNTNSVGPVKASTSKKKTAPLLKKFTLTPEQRRKEQVASLINKTTGQLKPINDTNYQSFLPLLSNKVSERYGLTETQGLTQRKTALTDILYVKYKNLKQKPNRSDDENLEFVTLQNLNTKYNLKLNTASRDTIWRHPLNSQYNNVYNVYNSY